MNALSEMADLIARHMPEDGIAESPLERLTLIRSSEPTIPCPAVYDPSLCLVAQGRKHATLGDQTYVYDAARYLLVSLDLPVVGHVIEASLERPYLCFKLSLDLAMVGELMMDCGGDTLPPGHPPALGLYESDPALIDAAVRLLRLLDRPADAAILAPMIQREILYRLLTGDQGAMLRHITTARSRLAQVSRAIGWIKRNFHAPFSIGALADEAGMSPSSLHEHFRAVTTMSPLQYQKQIRLQEARRLMLVDTLDAASAGFRVGYESPSQFSREYRRLFGAPPRREIETVRGGGLQPA